MPTDHTTHDECGAPVWTGKRWVCPRHSPPQPVPTPENCTKCMNWQHTCLCPLLNNAVVPFVVGSAVRYHGTLYAVRRPGRHHNVFALMRQEGIEHVGDDHEQGFLISDGCFVRFAHREEAHAIAKSAGQLSRDLGDNYPLTSEDLW